MNLYVTADRVGQANHGAGAVTRNESEAIRSLNGPGSCLVRGRQWLETLYLSGEEPWQWDDALSAGLKHGEPFSKYSLAHFYAGTFSKTVAELRCRGCKVTYTAAAHSIEESKREHEELGIPYTYKHLVQPDLWRRYLQGYKDADVLIVPSTHSRDVMRSFGCENRIEVIPHGVELPETVAPLPEQFVVGYLGNCCAPDKGLRYLFAAWAKLNYSDAVLKVAGHDSTSEYVQQLWLRFGGRGNVMLCGWQDDLSVFYNSLSLYVQPSVSEGFGIEICESLASARVVLGSTGAGAVDCIPDDWKFASRNVAQLVELIHAARTQWDLNELSCRAREIAKNYEWSNVRAKYVDVWEGLLDAS